MDGITLKGFRCFREEQTARLVPPTLLVGENSTGKTSFMAMIRALWDTAHGFQIPDFRETPYDLGSFDGIASPERRLVVETHSDHLLDRVRMDVRDGRTRLKPDDVSILFFERRGLDVRIHSLRLDEHGNIGDQPEGYRCFFMEETSRSLGL